MKRCGCEYKVILLSNGFCNQYTVVYIELPRKQTYMCSKKYEDDFNYDLKIYYLTVILLYFITMDWLKKLY